MAAQTEPRSGIQYGWALGENSWHTGMDANLLWLGRFGTHLSVKDRGLSTPPASPAAGDTYIVGAAGAGAWSTHDNKVAVWSGSAWVFGAPRVGWMAFIEDEAVLSIYKSTGWSAGVAF